MNYLDLILGIPLLWGAYKGFSKGLIISVASLLALIAGIYGSIRFSHFTTYYLENHFEFQSEYLPIISFALTFVLIVIAIHFLAKLLHRLVKAVALGWINTIAGTVFGIVKTALILSTILLIIQRFDVYNQVITPSMKEDSVLYKPIKGLAPALLPSIKSFSLPEVESLDILEKIEASKQEETDKAVTL